MIAGEFSDLDCEHCEKAGPAFRDSMGCEQPTPNPLYSEVPGIGDLHRCPLALLTADTRESMRLYAHYREGRLLSADGLEGQPVTYLLAMELIEAAVNGSVARQRKTWEDEQERKSRRR